MALSTINQAKGVVYGASGDRYIQEAIQSVATLKTVMPELPAVLFTDLPEKVQGSLFDAVLPLAAVHRNFLDKIQAIQDSPFERTLFVDTDVYFCRSCLHLFDALDRFDVAATHEPSRNHDFMERVPDYFPELNTGVVLLRRTPAVQTFLSDWHAALVRQMEETDFTFDQLPFRELIFRSSLQFLTLGQEYNFRSEYPATLHAWAKLYIIHARQGDFPEVKRIAEQSYKPRLFVPSLDYLEPRYLATFTPRSQWALYFVLRWTRPIIARLGAFASRFLGKGRWQPRVAGNKLPWPPQE